MELYFIFYSIVSFIAVAVHLVVNWPQLIGWRKEQAHTGAFALRIFLVSLLLFFISDFLWGVFSGLVWPHSLYVDTVFYFLAMALSVYAWARYIVAYLDMKGWPRSCLVWSGRGMLVYFIVALAANTFTDGFFTINDKAEFAAGPLRYAAFLLMIAFNVLVFGLTCAQLRHAKGALRRRNKVVLAFSIAITAAISM